MTLQERCDALVSKIEAGRKLKLADKEAEALRKRLEELHVSKEQISNELAKLLVLRRRQVNVGKLPSPLPALERLSEIKGLLTDHPEEANKNLGQAKRTIDAFGRALGLLADKTIEMVNRDLPSIDESFLKQVELIPEYTLRVVNIREKRQLLLNGRDVKAMRATELDQFLERRDALRSLTDQLLPAEFPKEVLEFFKAARHDGAPLDKFTDTVREWLVKRNQLKNVRVIVKH